MIEIDTKDWPITLWYEAINWCWDTFGPENNEEWRWADDYSFYISEKNLPMFLLRWS